ncbi:hypothetical protein ACFY7C_30080 [Streptomyces sp. NPDC012769]|uniref:hypothetical protein n=1 Tax=Streptomyces sp. NPDC012769 TaxID=3364848 RepID=UPI0036AB2AFB
MSVVPDPVQELSATLVKLPPWVALAKQYDETKVVVSNLSSTISGIKGDITLMKFEMAGLFAASVGLFKVDYTWFKIDDKGITINGRQRLGWPWADKAKAFQVRVENKQRDLYAKQNRLKRKLTRLTDRQDELTRAQARLRHQESAQRAAQDRLDAGRGSQAAVDRHAAKVKETRDQIADLQKKLDRAKKSARRTSKSAAKLVTKINDLSAKETAAKNLWKGNAATAVADLNSLRTALGQTTVALASTS